MAERDNNRSKILGNLIREARIQSGRSTSDCASVLGTTSHLFEQAEQGEYGLSLPELEALAIYLDVPMAYFWGSEPLNKLKGVDFANFITLRHRVIGIMLRQLRLKARRSPQDLAQLLKVSVEQIEAYELGTKPVPYLHLEQLSKFLESSVVHFVDNEKGPLARHEAEQRQQKNFRQLSPEMQEFIINPRNSSYLEAAKLLSAMDVQKLRDFAASLLDITL